MEKSRNDISEILDFLKKTAVEAGIFIVKNYKKDLQTDVKARNDLVTESDRLSQELIIKRISEKYPDHSIIAEENEIISTGAEGPTWIIDPIDGTTNYAHGFPFFAVSIGFAMNGKMMAGAVHNPVINETFRALRGVGAWLNDTKINCSECSDLGSALLATGFPYDRGDSEKNNLINFNRLILQCQGMRRAGSASLDICHVAAGRLDGFWELKLKPWDIAASSLIAQEAGALVSSLKTDNKGDKLFTADFDIFCGDIIVTAPALHEVIADNLYEK